MDSLYFPAGKSGNVIRGAFGSIFRKLACVPHCPGARDCELRASCAYARIFEPAAITPVPSGLGDWPRPFVFRAAHLDGQTVAPCDEFHFDLHLFYPRAAELAYFVQAFAQVAREGLGPRRGRADLVAVDQIGASRVYQDGTLKATTPPMVLPLAPDGPVSRLSVRFLTPTELKGGQGISKRPEFGVLFGRIRDRLSTLRALYGPGPLSIDFKALGERAGGVKMTRCELRWRDIERRSSKTGQRHPLGGFVGEAGYEGELGEFVPYLRAAQWVGVGRHTVWGKGVVELIVTTSSEDQIPAYHE